MNLFSSSKIWVLVKAVLDFLFFFALLSFLSSILSGKWSILLICLVKFCVGWGLILCPLSSEQTPLPNDRPVSLVTGHHQPIRGQDSDQTDQSEAMTHHYPGLVIVSCQCQVKLMKMPAQRLLWFSDFLWALWMTSEQGGRLSNCIVISVMKIDRTLIELANHHQQPGWAQQKHRNTSNITPHWMSCSI